MKGGVCRCGSRAFFLSKLTLPERLALWLGVYNRADTSSLDLTLKPLGGRREVIQKQWHKPDTNGMEGKNGPVQGDSEVGTERETERETSG